MIVKECTGCEEKLPDMLREIRLTVSGCRHAGMHHRSIRHDEDGMQSMADESDGNRKKPI
jgi:hypothetical protein